MVKNKKLILLTIIVALLIVFICACNLNNLSEGELMKTSVSPTKEYTVNAYLCSGNATTDFSVRCEAVNAENQERRNIYWQYHEEADIE